MMDGRSHDGILKMFMRVIIKLLLFTLIILVVCLVLPFLTYIMYLLTYINMPVPENLCIRDINGTHSIPKIIHQTWKSRDIPDKFKSYQEECQRLNPGYTIRLWTDEDIDELLHKEYRWFIPTYEGYTYNIQRVDSARYFILDAYGGIYIDIDIKCVAPFDKMVASMSHNADVILAGVF